MVVLVKDGRKDLEAYRVSGEGGGRLTKVM